MIDCDLFYVTLSLDEQMLAESSQLGDLLDQARHGDEEARNRLFSACRSFVTVMARVQLHRQLQAKVDPSDVVQQSLLEAHCGFPEFQGQTPQDWLAWLKQIVRHNIIDTGKQYRDAERRDVRKEQTVLFQNNSTSQVDLSPVDPRPSPSQFLMNAERELQLADAIESLSDEYRQVIILRNLERLPFEQVADRMNRSRGACQMLWMRAIETLRQQLSHQISI